MVSFDYTFDHIDMSSLEITIPKTYQAIDSYEQDCINIITIIDAALKKREKATVISVSSISKQISCCIWNFLLAETNSIAVDKSILRQILTILIFIQ